MPKIFLLSPAYCGGRRAGILLRDGSDFALARQLRDGTLSLGAAFSFMSGLYFRGKISYATAFEETSGTGGDTTLIITPTRGLQAPDLPVTAELLREFASVDVSLDNPRYRAPLERDIEALVRRISNETRVVLLGSVATGKYVDLLCPALGDRLLYPASFIGRGDMSRGGLLLRSVSSATELEYAILQPGMRPRGPRPPRLVPRRA